VPDKAVSLLVDWQEEETIALVRDLVKQGANPMSILDDARLAMETVGKRFASCEYFIPDLVWIGA
jgi:methanogenic corrinoid protein MtbC1